MKILLLAALLGFAASTSIAGISKSIQLLNLNALSVNAFVQADTGYGTHWGIYDYGQLWNSGNIFLMGYPFWYTEYYGVDIYSKARLTLTVLFD